MVKLFVGNLSDAVDSHRLRNLFLQYAQVQECDVLKNFAFVHVPTEEEADICIEKLNKSTLEGREIHIERSTSKLRKEPGMSDKCFTCGATDHKTPNCPQEQGRKKRTSDSIDGPGAKKPSILPTINLTAPSSILQTSWSCKPGGGSDADPELPCPTNPELRKLYDEYLEARTKYFFYRDRLSKELALQPTAVVQQQQQPIHVGRIDLTRAQPQQFPATAVSKPAMLIQQSVPMVVQPQSQPLQYSVTPASYQSAVSVMQQQQPLQQQQPNIYASTQQSIAAAPVSVYSTGQQQQPVQQSYATATSIHQQQQVIQQQQQQPATVQIASSLQPASQQASLAPAAPYNTMTRPAQTTIVNYGVQQQPSAYLVQQQPQQNGQQMIQQQPAATYSTSAAYRPQAQLQTNVVHSYSTISSAPR